MGFDPITVVNFVLSIIIFVLGVALYGRKKNVMTLYIGIAFGLFAISHMATLLDLAATLTVQLIVVRAIAYIIVILALLTFWKK
ncbi:MAG: hypothetical protein ABSF63_09230 [Candidatus Bathyarchaeia archaeon]|jgi:hypothetical protein